MFYQNNFGGNMEMTSIPQGRNLSNQRTNITYQNQNEMYQNDYNMQFSNFDQQSYPYYECNTNDTMYYSNQSCPPYMESQYNNSNFIHEVDPHVFPNQYNNSYCQKQRRYVEPISEYEYEKEKRNEVRIERSNMTSTQQPPQQGGSFLHNLFQSIF